MRSALSAVCFSLLSGAAGLAAPPAQEKGIVGTWVVESVKGSGEDVPLFKGARLALSDGKVELKTANGERLAGTYKLDPAANPKAIDLALKVGDFSITHKGLYVLEKDALTLYLPSGRDADRPEKLDGQGCDVWTLKRAE